MVGNIAQSWRSESLQKFHDDEKKNGPISSGHLWPCDQLQPQLWMSLLTDTVAYQVVSTEDRRATQGYSSKLNHQQHHFDTVQQPSANKASSTERHSMHGSMAFVTSCHCACVDYLCFMRFNKYLINDFISAMTMSSTDGWGISHELPHGPCMWNGSFSLEVLSLDTKCQISSLDSQLDH